MRACKIWMCIVYRVFVWIGTSIYGMHEWIISIGVNCGSMTTTKTTTELLFLYTHTDFTFIFLSGQSLYFQFLFCFAFATSHSLPWPKKSLVHFTRHIWLFQIPCVHSHIHIVIWIEKRMGEKERAREREREGNISALNSVLGFRLSIASNK